jgi:hypothetical protein
MANKILPVYILIRTAERPLFFERMMQSIKIQTYTNIITIVHSDNLYDRYIEGDIILRSKRDTSKGRGHYNLYCNKLLNAIPPGKGWYHFLDDDDEYCDQYVIEKLVEKSQKRRVNVARVDRGDGFIWPKYWRNQSSFSGECIFMRAEYKSMAHWIAKRRSDHYYTKQLTNILPINWIDDLIISRAQVGSGRGLRLDAGAKNE